MYLDSSIIVKLLVPEPDSDFFEANLVGESLSSSELAWTEVFSALLAKERNGQINAQQREKAWRTFVGWVESEQIRLHKLNTVTLKRANRVLGHGAPEGGAEEPGRHSRRRVRSLPGFPAVYDR